MTLRMAALFVQWVDTEMVLLTVTQAGRTRCAQEEGQKCDLWRDLVGLEPPLEHAHVRTHEW